MANFIIAHLETGTLNEAWPLVHVAAPELKLSAWQDFAEQLIGDGGGILAARSVEGGMQGLAAYRIEHCLRSGLTLKVDTLIAFDLHHRSPVKRALIDALATVGRALGCASLAVTVASRGFVAGGDKSVAWQALGLNLESVLFTRRLPRRGAVAATV